MATALTYQETLRTLGTLLDLEGSDRAVIAVSPHGAEVVAYAWDGHRAWTTEALRRESAVQQAWRGRPDAYKLPPEGMHRLRAIAAELDAVGGDAYVLTAQPEGIRVQSHTGYDRSIDAAALKRRMKLAQYLRGQGVG